DGNRVRAYNRRAAGTLESGSWSARGAIRSLADGPERGMVLVLDGSSLSLVKFYDDRAPQQLWTHPVSRSGSSTAPGQLVIRDGRQVFVADASLPGVRVLTLDPAGEPVTAATWFSADGAVRQLSLWNRALTVATSGSLTVLDASGSDAPSLRSLGRSAL